MMRIRIGLPSYKLVYESGSEDVMWRREVDSGLAMKAQQREEDRRRSKWAL